MLLLIDNFRDDIPVKMRNLYSDNYTKLNINKSSEFST